jgi:extracellular elastinolytic metalloproteinase
VGNPADAFASPFGWHDTNGVPGADFTITCGNNVHAYLDQDDDEQQDFGGSSDGGAGLDFDFPADLTEHSQFYRDAVVTNLFYGCNTFHDIFERYGFDEAADNFQSVDYGGGPFSNGDYVRCEAADGSGTNNANFSTPASGGTPRMQMFLWPGNQFGSQNQVALTGGASFGANWARYGPPATNAGVTNQIALVDRGTCTFQLKTQNAQAAGASAVIIANNAAGNLPILAGSFVNAPETIPTVGVSQADGAAIKAALPATGTVRKSPTHPGIRDGDFENGIIYHEYGHGLSNRLTGGPGKPSTASVETTSKWARVGATT